jgi:hypothetical protein
MTHRPALGVRRARSESREDHARPHQAKDLRRVLNLLEPGVGRLTIALHRAAGEHIVGEGVAPTGPVGAFRPGSPPQLRIPCF